MICLSRDRQCSISSLTLAQLFGLCCFSFWCPEQDVRLLLCMVCFFARFCRSPLRLIGVRLCGSVAFFVNPPTHPSWKCPIDAVWDLNTVCRRLLDLACGSCRAPFVYPNLGSFIGGSDVRLTTAPYGTRSFFDSFLGEEASKRKGFRGGWVGCCVGCCVGWFGRVECWVVG